MIERFSYKTITWLDVTNPTNDEIRDIITEAHIPPDLADDVTVQIPQNTFIARKGVMKAVLDFPIVKRTDINHPHEVKFLVTKTHLVTIRFEDIEAIHRFGKEFEVRCMLQNGKTTTTPKLFLTLLGFMYDGLYSKLDYLESRLAEIEVQIFAEKEREMVTEISHVSRRLIAFRQIIDAHQETLENLDDAIVTGFGKKFAGAAEPITHHYSSLMRRMQTLVATLDDLRETNMGLLTTKQNEVMKTFTILAFITFPLTLFTSLFGMNTVTTPIVGDNGDFWIILGIMVIVTIFFFVYFKYKKWI